MVLLLLLSYGVRSPIPVMISTFIIIMHVMVDVVVVMACQMWGQDVLES